MSRFLRLISLPMMPKVVGTTACFFVAALIAAGASAQSTPASDPQPGDPPFVGGLRERPAEPDSAPQVEARRGPRLWPVIDFTHDIEGQTPHRTLWPFFRQGVWRRGERLERTVELVTLIPFMPFFGHVVDDRGRSEWDLLLLQWGVSPDRANEWFLYLLPIFGYKQNDTGYRHVIAPPIFAWWNRSDYRSLFVFPVFLGWNVARPAPPATGPDAAAAEADRLAQFSIVPFYSWARAGVRPRIPSLSWKTPHSWGVFPFAYGTSTEDFSSLGLAWPFYVRQRTATGDLTSMMLSLLYRGRELRAHPLDPERARQGDPEAFRFVTRDGRVLLLASWLTLRVAPDYEVIGAQRDILPFYEYERAPNDARHLSILSPFVKPFRGDAPDGSRSWAALLGLVNYRTAPDEDLRVFNFFDIRLLRTEGLFRYKADGADRELRLLAPWGFGPRLRWQAGPS